jgi:hypothetical protein
MMEEYLEINLSKMIRSDKRIKILNFFQAYFVTKLLCSPIVWVWVGWGLAWKIGLSALIGMASVLLIHLVISKAIKDVIKDAIVVDDEESIIVNERHLRPQFKKSIDEEIKKNVQFREQNPLP